MKILKEKRFTMVIFKIYTPPHLCYSVGFYTLYRYYFKALYRLANPTSLAYTRVGKAA